MTPVCRNCRDLSAGGSVGVQRGRWPSPPIFCTCPFKSWAHWWASHAGCGLFNTSHPLIKIISSSKGGLLRPRPPTLNWCLLFSLSFSGWGAFFFFFKFHFIYLFFLNFLWLFWVFVSVRGLSLVAASGGHSSSQCAGLSPSRRKMRGFWKQSFQAPGFPCPFSSLPCNAQRLRSQGAHSPGSHPSHFSDKLCCPDQQSLSVLGPKSRRWNHLQQRICKDSENA